MSSGETYWSLDVVRNYNWQEQFYSATGKLRAVQEQFYSATGKLRAVQEQFYSATIPVSDGTWNKTVLVLLVVCR
jgi:hypothetical protein